MTWALWADFQTGNTAPELEVLDELVLLDELATPDELEVLELLEELDVVEVLLELEDELVEFLPGHSTALTAPTNSIESTLPRP